MVKVIRKTKETRIEVSVAASTEANPRIEIATFVKSKKVGEPDESLAFFDHMLTAFARYAGLDVTIDAHGDLRHHLMEDVALALGGAIREIIPAHAARYGERTVPMDDALVGSVIDIGGRPFFVGKLPNRLYTHVLRSLSTTMAATLHVRIIRGGDRHHVIEAAFKSTGLALRQALSDSGSIFSTKGSVSWETSES